MKRLVTLALIYFLILAPFASAQTPGFVNSALQISTFIAAGNTQVSNACNAGANSETTFFFCLVDPSLSGNTIIATCGISDAPGTTMSITDDKSDSYISQIRANHTGGQDVQIFVSSGVAAGTHELKLTTSVAATGIQCEAEQVFNVSTSGQPCATAVSATSAGSTVGAAGSMTPAVANCFFYQVLNQDSALNSCSISTDCVTFTGNSSPAGTLATAAIRTGWVSQFFVQPSTSAVNPTITQSAANGFVTAAIALKPATQGTAPPSGINILSFSQNGLQDSKSLNFFQVPCAGNLIAVAYNGNTDQALIQLNSTNPTTTWDLNGTSANTEGVIQIFNNHSAISPGNSTTIQLDSTPLISAGNAGFYCIGGAVSGPQRDSAIPDGLSSGNVGSFTTPVTTSTVTPFHNAGVTIGSMGIALNGSLNCLPSNCTTGVAYVQDNQDENNLWAHFYYSTKASQTFNIAVDQRSAAGGIGSWSADFVSYESNTASNPPSGLTLTKKTIFTKKTVLTP